MSHHKIGISHVKKFLQAVTQAVNKEEGTNIELSCDTRLIAGKTAPETTLLATYVRASDDKPRYIAVRV